MKGVVIGNKSLVPITSDFVFVEVRGMHVQNLLKIRINNIALIQYILIYILIQYIGGRLSVALGSDIFYGGTILLCTVLILLMPFRIHINKRYFWFLLTSAMSMFITFFITKGSLQIGTILSILSRFLIVYAAIKIDNENFINRFLKLTYFMAIISLCEFALVQLVGIPTAHIIFSKLYEIKSRESWIGNSYGLFFICYNFMTPTRNAYMFGEPGEFQSLLITALFFLTFWNDRIKIEKRTWYYVIFLITMLTVQSTTGFLNLIVLIISALIINESQMSPAIRNLLVVGCLILAVYLCFFYTSDSFLYTSFFGKVTDDTGSLDFNVSTGAARLGPINRLISTFKEMPEKMIFGVGFEGLKATPLKGYSTGGVINMIAMLGIITSGIIYGKLISSSARYARTIPQLLFMIFYIINMGISQPDLLTITSILICMYGEYSNIIYIES